MKIEVINNELVFVSESKDEYDTLTRLAAKMNASGVIRDTTQRILSITPFDDEKHIHKDDHNYQRVDASEGEIVVTFKV